MTDAPIHAPRGQFPATIDDVARLAGVSTATVSRALRGRGYVSDETRRKVREAATGLNYVANANASRLASGQARTVGLLAPMLTSWYTSEIVVGVEEVLAEERFDLLIGSANELARERIFGGNAEFQQRTDGVILVDVFCGEAGAQRLAATESPVVVTGERLASVSSVAVDNARGGRMAAKHLIELGHRRMAVVGGMVHPNVPPNVPSDRLSGFAAVLGPAGLRLPESSVEVGHFTIEGGRVATLRLMQQRRPPTAIFLLSDEMGFGALQALRELGLQPGVDVSLIGFDDHPVSVAVGLSTVQQPVRAIGRLAARALLDQVTGFGTVQHYPIGLELVARSTSGPPRTL